MQIAENLVKQGITSGEKFANKLTEFVREHCITKVIETGTHHGTGTTKAILNGLTAPFQFITIEVNPHNWAIASKNLSGITGLTLINGLSVGRSDLPVSISADLPDFVIIDHQPDNRWDLYSKEVHYNVPDHQLWIAMKSMDFKPELVLLDSAGHMGLLEFLYTVNRLKGDCYIALDDTDHYKHYQSMNYVLGNPKKFEVVWQINSKYLDPIDGDKFGSAIIKYTHDGS